jgi:hypothetical protein
MGYEPNRLTGQPFNLSSAEATARQSWASSSMIPRGSKQNLNQKELRRIDIEYGQKK